MSDEDELTECANCGEEVLPVGSQCPVCGFTTLADDIISMVWDGEEWVEADQ